VRHLVVECPVLTDKSREVTARYSLAPGWLGGLPRVETKSGWIVFAAHQQHCAREDGDGFGRAWYRRCCARSPA
jgi:hypothetical protein